jgi:seryl-tRNA synthetase
MIDIKKLRENPEIFKEGAKRKFVDIDIDKILYLDNKNRELQSQIDKLRHEQKKLSLDFSKNKNKDLYEKIKLIKKEIEEKENEKESISNELLNLLYLVPNPPAKDVPDGKTEEENVPIKFWGQIPNFDFEFKDYISLMKELNLVDLERGAKVGGFRQYFIKNEAVILELALLRWSLDFLKEQGFEIFRPTSLVKKFALYGTGMFPQGEEETYKLEEDLYLAGTTEVPLMGYFSDEILEEKDLPIKMAGISCAFRKEVGSYGKDVKGIFRVHEFWQTEQVILHRNDLEETIFWHEKLLENIEKMMQLLEIPYRVVNVCAGELSLGQVKRYDLEAWVPSQKRYRETHSDSYLLDFQTRRLNIRYKDKNGNLHFPYSLNNTAIAVPRILIPLIENHQQKDGSIKIPKVLVPYCGFEKIPAD